MPDVLTPAQRSHCMSRIRGRDTGPELKLRKALWAYGLRYRVLSKLPGRPDLVFPRQRVAVFVDGCFWHGCPRHYNKPRARAKFWREKHQETRARDLKVNQVLTGQGWRVLRFWEHELEADFARVCALVRAAMHQPPARS